MQHIAEMVGKTVNALGVVLHRGRRALRECMIQSKTENSP